MKRNLLRIVIGLIIAFCIVMGILSGIDFTPLQKETLNILIIIALSSAAYCFIVGEIAKNNSQMDKLWSILPIVYLFVVLIKSQFNIRIAVFFVIVLLWGIRLTYNFARKGAYSIKFWTGEEDYRWAVLRSDGLLKNRFLWALFDLFFISLYQNFIVLAITFPAVACMESLNAFGVSDIIFTVIALGFLALETVADEYQWKFHKTKKELLKSGKLLKDLPSPYNKGFNTTGIWAYMRHPNYLGEQGIWVSVYLFTVGAGVIKYGVFNWSIIGCLLLILLFMGSSAFGEKITLTKYDGYSEYSELVLKYIPTDRYVKRIAKER